MFKCAPHLALLAILCVSCVSAPNGDSGCQLVANQDNSGRDADVLNQKASKWFNELLVRLPPAATTSIDEDPGIEDFLYRPTYEVIACNSAGWEERATIFLVETPHNLNGSLDYMPYKVWEFKTELLRYLFTRLGLPLSLDRAVSRRLAANDVDERCYIAMCAFPYWTATYKLANEKIKAWINKPDSRHVVSWLFYTANLGKFATDIVPYVKRIAMINDEHTKYELSNLSAWLGSRDLTAELWRKEFADQVANSPFKGWFSKE